MVERAEELIEIPRYRRQDHAIDLDVADTVAAVVILGASLNVMPHSPEDIGKGFHHTGGEGTALHICLVGLSIYFVASLLLSLGRCDIVWVSTRQLSV